MRIRMLGRIWWLMRVSKKKLRRGTCGDCDPPNKPKKAIRLQEDLVPEEELRVLIHEFLHACAWWADEDWVHRSSTDIASALWRLGWRKGDEDR